MLVKVTEEKPQYSQLTKSLHFRFVDEYKWGYF